MSAVISDPTDHLTTFKENTEIIQQEISSLSENFLIMGKLLLTLLYLTALGCGRACSDSKFAHTS